MAKHTNNLLLPYTMPVSIVDILIVLILMWSCWRGYKKGAASEIFHFLRLITFIFAAITLMPVLIRLLPDYIHVSPLLIKVIAFATVFVGVFLLFYIIKMLFTPDNADDEKKQTTQPSKGLCGKLGAAIFSMCKTFVFLCVVVLLLSFLPFDVTRNALKENSVIASGIIRQTPVCYGYVTQRWNHPAVHTIGDILQKNAATTGS